MRSWQISEQMKKAIKMYLFLWVSWSSWSRDASSALRALSIFIFLLQVFELLLVSETALLGPPAVLLPQEVFLTVLQPLGPITKALILLQNQSALRRFDFLVIPEKASREITRIIPTQMQTSLKYALINHFSQNDICRQGTLSDQVLISGSVNRTLIYFDWFGLTRSNWVLLVWLWVSGIEPYVPKSLSIPLGWAAFLRDWTIVTEPRRDAFWWFDYPDS